MTSKQIITELENLTSKKSIDVSRVFDYTEEFNYEPIKHYIKSIGEFNTKPESASHELFKVIVKDVLKYETFGEVNLKGGFVDFVIKESVGNPVLIELKPLFKLIKSKNNLKPEELDFKEHKEQVLKYLKNNDYVILTNLKESFLFSRNAIIDFEPFAVMTFAEMLKSFLEYQNLWDTIRRIEDQNIKSDLDKAFFIDLKKWYKEFKEIKFIENERFTKEELIVILLNKVIFIKTLDDWGLIQFNQLVDEYLDKKEKWGAKGSERILTRFFAEIEEYFDYFYDTELFKIKFWDYVVKEKANTDKFLEIFETALGLDKWQHTFGRGMLHYQYRWIDEDIFGKAYETFIAENKKDSGIYYTSKEVTQYMAKRLVEQVFEPVIQELLLYVDKNKPNFEEADRLMLKLTQIKIADTASGSGSFLIKILREIYSGYQKIDDATSWINKISQDNLFDMPDSYAATKDFRTKHFFVSPLKLISLIILRHIYAADIDERAIETAKTNMWKEAIKLNPRIYNYKKLNGESSHILPNLELNFICGDSIADLEIEKQLEIISTEFNDEILELHEIRNEYLANPFHPEKIDTINKIKKNIFTRLHNELPQIEKPVFICLEFFHCFFDNNGKPLSNQERGFDGIIGNPPWEAIKPIEKEFAGKGKGELDVLNFKKWFEDKLNTDKKFSDDWDKYVKSYDVYKDYISRHYQYQDVGDTNYYKLFLERDFNLLKYGGVLNLLVPSGIQTDKGCSQLRRLFLSIAQLNEIYSFENRGYTRIVNNEEISAKIFPEVDSRFKFTIVNTTKLPSQPFGAFDAKFYMLDPNDLNEKVAIKYDLEMVERFSPENLSIMEFRSHKDYELCKKIRNNHGLLTDFDFTLHRELDMTIDSYMFHQLEEIEKKKDQKKVLRLFEGKMIHQYSSSYDEPRYFIYEKEARKQLLATETRNIKRQFELSDKQIEKLNPKLEYENYRLAYRAIGRSTDERTLIASIVPTHCFIGHSMNYLRNITYQKVKNKIVQMHKPPEEMLLLMSLFNSLTLNYYIRNKISANLTMNFIYELPIPNLTQKQKEYLVNEGLTLLNYYDERKQFKKLFEELGYKPKTKINAVKVRAEIELFIAKEIFGLNANEWSYLTSTFTFGGDTATRKELTEIIAASLS
ncbi:MAG: endonuclease-methyltransferase fusion protein [Ignavibacteria bacterium]|nr:MAG: endonuclease-methyltransferase fusion protein [Ignavibacteria bacterium]KAF0156894.1 MAG: endonuclease-methyltransferase fusion protein [Ignavibacteria bacterium]